MADRDRTHLKVYHKAREVYLVPLGSPSDPNARGVLFDSYDGALSEPRLLQSINAHVGGNCDWSEVPDAEIPAALKARLATLG